MVVWLRYLLCCVVTPVLLMACAANNVRQAQSVDVVAGQLEIAERSTVVQHHGTVDLLYFNPRSELVLQRADGTELVLGDEGAGENARRAYGVLHPDGDNVYALWRPKMVREVSGVGSPGEKFIYVRTSNDKGKTFGPAQRLDNGGGAFNPSVVSSGQGDVYVIYPDERNRELDLYMNVSHDYGASWKKEDFKVNGTESLGMSLNPSMVTDGARIYVAWMTQGTDKQFKLFVRHSTDRGEHWSEPVAALSSSKQPDSHKLVKTADTLLLCWLHQDAVRCSRSNDKNQSWSEPVALDDSAGAEGIFMETDSKGRAHLLVAKKPESDQARLNLFHAATTGDAAFPALQRISGGTPHTANTVLPLMTFGDDDSMLITWVDMRYARPVIAANHSKDGGVTWLPENLVLAAQKGLYHLFPTAAYAGNGTYRLAWQEAATRSDATTVIRQRTFAPGSKGISMPEPDIKRLKQRVNAFWNLRQEDKWEQVYDYMDPFFREANSRKGYAKSQGMVKYYSHRLTDEPTINGVIALVPMTYESEVPEIMLHGKKVSVPKQEVEIKHEWIWVDGDWYQVFRDIKNGTFLPF